MLEQVAEEANRQGQGYQLVFADYAHCILELGQGRYEAAYASFAAGIDDTSQVKFVLANLVEAAQRSGHGEAAADLVARLAMLAAASPGPVLLGFLARARALTAGDVASAEDHYREAIDQHGRARGQHTLATKVANALIQDAASPLEDSASGIGKAIRRYRNRYGGLWVGAASPGPQPSWGPPRTLSIASCMSATVWMDSWQMQCCGEAFHFGPQVAWTLGDADPDWLKAMLGTGERLRPQVRQAVHPGTQIAYPGVS